MLLLGLALANRLLEIPLPPDMLNAIFDDSDVLVLAQRMPKSLLAQQQDGIDVHDGPALYFSLKDTGWDRWRYGWPGVAPPRPSCAPASAFVVPMAEADDDACSYRAAVSCIRCSVSPSEEPVPRLRPFK